MSTIEINNVQTIRDLVIDIPDDSGGVVVIKGENGTGKSTAIKLMAGLLKGEGKFSPTDGAKKGSVEGLGKKMTVGGTTRHTGDLEVPSIEGRLDFSDLVRPQAKDLEVRDKIRIKALITLAGAEPDPSIFYPVLGDKDRLEAVVGPEAFKSSDLIEMAAKIRKAIHDKAKQVESDADREDGYAKSCRDAAGEVQEELPDMEALHADAYKAEAELASLRQKRESAAETVVRMQELTAELNRLSSEDQGPSYESSKGVLISLEQQKAESDSRIAAIKSQLAKEESAQRDLLAKIGVAKEVATAAHRREAAIESLRKSVAAITQPDEVGDLDIALAEQEAAESKKRVERGAQAHAAKAKAEEAKKHSKAAKSLREKAADLRDAARSVDACLSSALPPGPLKAVNGRLVMETKRGPETLYDECSDGERWLAALPYGIRSVGKGGIIPVIQDAWQDLDDRARMLVAKACLDAKVWIVTAEVAPGELRAEQY